MKYCIANSPTLLYCYHKLMGKQSAKKEDIQTWSPFLWTVFTLILQLLINPNITVLIFQRSLGWEGTIFLIYVFRILRKQSAFLAYISSIQRSLILNRFYIKYLFHVIHLELANVKVHQPQFHLFISYLSFYIKSNILYSNCISYTKNC